jgi:hypothetical protein
MMTVRLRPTAASVCVLLLLAVVAISCSYPGASTSRGAASASEPPPATSAEEPDAAAGEAGDTGAYEEHTFVGERHEARARTQEREAALADALAASAAAEPAITVHPARGWAGENLWSRHSNDWEPAIAADPTRPFVYMLGTRYGGARACAHCPRVTTRLRISKDDGRTWSKAGFLCPCPGTPSQYDPQIEVARNGDVYAAFLRGFSPGVTFRRSKDHGKSWSRPVSFRSFGSKWSDKPSLAVSPNGRDVYIAYNGPSKGDSWMAQSHDGGRSWSAAKIRRSERYIFAGGGAATNSGVVAFGGSDYNQRYTGFINTIAVVSDDGGASWSHVHVARGNKQPDCTSDGCYDGFYGPTPAIARDGNGDLVIAFAANHVREGRQRLYVARSTDDGRTWGRHQRLSATHANAIFPAITGGGDGDIRLWWMDTRTGRWNTWYRSSSDGGRTWSRALRISDATAGPAYVSSRGFLEAYGDYGEIDITDRGRTVATWGEGPDYVGPGGIWFNRQT